MPLKATGPLAKGTWRSAVHTGHEDKLMLCDMWPQPLPPALSPSHRISESQETAPARPSLAYKNNSPKMVTSRGSLACCFLFSIQGSCPDVEAAGRGPGGGAARVVWAVGGPVMEEGARDEGLWCPCLVCRATQTLWGVGGCFPSAIRLPGTGKAGFALTAMARGDSLLEG